MTRAEKYAKIRLPDEDLEGLSDSDLDFLVEAERGGMRYIVGDNGCPLAWGAAVEGVFTCDVDVEPNLYDGFLVTPRGEE